MAYTLDVDFDIYKDLTYRRKSEDVTYNDVLRELLNLPPANKPRIAVPVPGERGWVGEGVTLPHGTELRARFKGKMYFGKIEDGAFAVDGRSFNSPTGAARYIVKRHQNGWIFWDCRLPGTTNWTLLNSLRNKS